MKHFFLLLLLFAATAVRAQKPVQQSNPQGSGKPAAPQAQLGWVQQQSGTDQVFFTVSFTSKDTGWAGSGGAVVHTTNGGQSWQMSSPPELGRVLFLDNLTGFVYTYSSAKVYKTVDGGQNWTSSNPNSQNLICASFPSRDTGFIEGAGFVSRTTDGGKSWDPKQEAGNGFNAMSFSDTRHGFVVGLPLGSFAWIRRTTDGGSTWNDVSNDFQLTLEAVHAFDDTTVIVAGASGFMALSHNGGGTWHRIVSGVNLGIFGFSFLNRQTGLAVGEMGEILRTQDGGLHWTKQHSPAMTTLYAAQLIDDSVGVIVGDSGTILITTNGGIEWVQLAPPSLESLNITAQQLPETPMIELRYSLPQMQDVTIEVYDLLGKRISTICERKIEPAGLHQITFDASHYPAGVYLFRVTTERYSGVGKIVLVK
jgi:photosystem II stability/assembly factor-like uncharacterized protein